MSSTRESSPEPEPFPYSPPYNPFYTINREGFFHFEIDFENLDRKLPLTDYLEGINPYCYTVPHPLEPPQHLNRGGTWFPDMFDDEHQKFEDIVVEFVQGRGFVILSVSLYTYSSRIDPTGPRNQKMVSVSIETDGSIDALRLLATELHEKLEDHGAPSVTVHSQTNVWYLYIDPLLNNEIGRRALESWKIVRQEVIEALNKNLTLTEAEWTNVCVFMCPGRDDPSFDCKYPTILVNLQYPAVANWVYQLNAIKEILALHKVDNLRVEFAYGHLDSTRSQGYIGMEIKSLAKYLPLRENPRETWDYGHYPISGDSIGMVNQPGSNTIGGPILLEDPNHKAGTRFCFLTTHHAVTAKDYGDNLEAFKQARPLRPRDCPMSNKYAQLRCPSEDDHEATSFEIVKEIELIESGYIWDLKVLEKNPHDADRHQARVQRNEEHHVWCMKRLNALRSWQQPFATVIASSGVRSTKIDVEKGCNHILKMDWAIAEFNDDNKFGEMEHRTSSSNANLWPRYEPNEHVVQKTAAIRPGMWVCMTGRTSGVTAGYVNMVAMDVRKCDMDIEPYREWVVVTTDGCNRGRAGFAQPGDNGAFVLDRKGRVVGMHTSVSYPDAWWRTQYAGIVPILEVFADIEEQTGARPRLAKFLEAWEIRVDTRKKEKEEKEAREALKPDDPL